MRELKQVLAVLLLLITNVIIGQNSAYVTADNGLTVREQPNPNARRVGKLDYGEAIEITEYTSVNLVLFDEGEKIEGKWVRIQTPALAGYVFNGFLSPDKMAESLEFRYHGLKMKLKNLNSTDEFKLHNFHDLDTVYVTVELGDSPEGKIISITNKNYKRIGIFQRHENSVTIMNEGPHCDLTEWEHFYSQWRPIQALSKSKFKTLTYSESEGQLFMDIDIDDLKNTVRNKCGEEWSNDVVDIKTVNDYPASVGISRIFLKILMTDNNDKVIEKIIVFEIPMGC